MQDGHPPGIRIRSPRNEKYSSPGQNHLGKRRADDESYGCGVSTLSGGRNMILDAGAEEGKERQRLHMQSYVMG